MFFPAQRPSAGPFWHNVEPLLKGQDSSLSSNSCQPPGVAWRSPVITGLPGGVTSLKVGSRAVLRPLRTHTHPTHTQVPGLSLPSSLGGQLPGQVVPYSRPGEEQSRRADAGREVPCGEATPSQRPLRGSPPIHYPGLRRGRLILGGMISHGGSLPGLFRCLSSSSSSSPCCPGPANGPRRASSAEKRSLPPGRLAGRPWGARRLEGSPAAGRGGATGGRAHWSPLKPGTGGAQPRRADGASQVGERRRCAETERAALCLPAAAQLGLPGANRPGGRRGCHGGGLAKAARGVLCPGWWQAGAGGWQAAGT